MHIRIEGLTMAYGNAVVVSDLDLDVRHGELLVLLGPSGCGKTTTMRCVAGLEQARAGRISIGDRVVVDVARGVEVPANKRNVGMVFQSYAIWPHMTVAENVGFPLKVQRRPRKEITKRVDETLALVGLDGFADRGASKLSGGQMQRVALARSLVMRPAVLLLDEPLSNLDAKLRDRLRFELRAIQLETGVTSIFVTHDQREALALADRIAVMREGKIVQLGDPRDLYLEPNSPFVADFLGAVNVFDGEVIGVANGATHFDVRLPGGEIVKGRPSAGFVPPSTGRVAVAIRPESIGLRRAAEVAAGTNVLPAQVQVASFLGSQTAYRLRLPSGMILETASSDSGVPFAKGEALAAILSADSVSVLPARDR
jgi:iron(III) transport system ATP-binding protein